MKLTKTLPALFALALLAGCASTCTDETSATEQKGDAACCKAGAAEGKACCSEAGSCTEKKAQSESQKN